MFNPVYFEDMRQCIFIMIGITRRTPRQLGF